jgi:hypothetical protein
MKIAFQLSLIGKAGHAGRLLSLLIVICVSACASRVTEDPAGGGLWGYMLHSHKYPARISEREKALAAARLERDLLVGKLRSLEARARQARVEYRQRGNTGGQRRIEALLGQVGQRQEELRALSLDQGSTGLRRIGREVADLEKALSAF